MSTETPRHCHGNTLPQRFDALGGIKTPLRAGRFVLANESPAATLYDTEHPGTTLLENDSPECAALVNAVGIDDSGWAVIPFGDWPHEMGMQKFGPEQARQIVAAFSGLAGKFRRAIIGLPIYKGHPDSPVEAIANMYPDKADKGQIAAMEVRDTGLALKLVLSTAGADLVRKGWKFISPMWIANLVSNVGDQLRVFAPCRMQSVGLVSKPNIPSPSLANAAPAANHKQNKTMNPETLKKLGLAANATPEQIEAAVTQLQERAATLANEHTAHATAKTDLATAQGKIVTLEASASSVGAKLTEAQTTLANERKARIGDLIANAILTGRILLAEKSTWETRLASNFETESAVLANAAPKVKTASEIPSMLKKLEEQMTTELANAKKKKGAGAEDDDEDEDDGKDECGMGNADYAKMDHKARGKKMTDLVNEHMQKLNNSPHPDKYSRAWANAKSANPRLFGFKQSDVTGE